MDIQDTITKNSHKTRKLSDTQVKLIVSMRVLLYITILFIFSFFIPNMTWFIGIAIVVKIGFIMYYLVKRFQEV